jgi:hypothetical protein
MIESSIAVNYFEWRSSKSPRLFEIQLPDIRTWIPLPKHPQVPQPCIGDRDVASSIEEVVSVIADTRTDLENCASFYRDA